MSFTSLKFILFLLLTVSLYYSSPKKHQWKILLVSSYIFYSFSGIKYLPYIILTTLSSYITARVISKNYKLQESFFSKNSLLNREEKKQYNKEFKDKRLRILIFGIVINTSILAVLKYSGFAIDNINFLAQIFNINININTPNLLLPLGISFYTFKSLGYLIDVYRQKYIAENNIFKFALFISFFPELLQGPISRYNDVSGDLYAHHIAKWENISSGFLRIAYGYFKKIIIADTIAISVNTIISNPKNYSGGYVFFLIIAYSAQIYADFTGGIDITLGLSEALGIRLKENFDHPFASISAKEYWNRWHISMGAWFTDYIFYPLSVSKSMQRLSKFSRNKFGNYIGKRIPVYLASFVTWFLTGLWHGAYWSFVVWGLLNCTVIIISQELNPLFIKFRKKFVYLTKSYAWTLFCRARTFFIIGAIRILDCYRDVTITFQSFFSIFTSFSAWNDMVSGGIFKLGLDVFDFALLITGIIFICIVSKFQKTDGVSLRHKISKNPILTCITICALIFSIIIFGAYGEGYDSAGFIYTQF